jgi:hypothetical protein
MTNSKKLFESFKNSKYRSLKHTNYFEIYDQIFKNFINKKIVFVEVGVSNGGSLFMWRDYLGLEARIIGIDFNPTARKWEKYGFDIFIGNQSDPEFWKSFYEKVGSIDILVDDGGHTNEQQIQTIDNSYKFINNGGVIVVEDVHASYLKEFGNPSSYSFINFCFSIVNKINNRSLGKNYINNYQNRIHKIDFYESLVTLHVDDGKCKKNQAIDNEGIVLNSEDFRLKDIKIFSIIDNYKVHLRSFISNKMYNFFKKKYVLLKFMILIFKKKKYKKFFY